MLIYIGVFFNSATIIIGIITGILRPPLSGKIENTIHTILAIGLFYIAIILSIELFSKGGLYFIKYFTLTWLCLISSSFIFKKSPLQQIIIKLNNSIQSSYLALKPGKKQSLSKISLIIGLVYFGITPLNFGAACLCGLLGSPLLFYVKSIIDLLGTIALTQKLRKTALFILIPQFILGTALIYIFQLFQLENTPCSKFVIIYFCLHLFLILIRVNKNSSSLFSVVPAFFLSIIFDKYLG